MQTNQFYRYLRNFTFKELRQLTIWAALSAVFVGIVMYGHSVGASSQITWDYVIMYGINSLIFFSLFKHYQALGTTMLTFIIFFDLAVFGYYFFSATSLNV